MSPKSCSSGFRSTPSGGAGSSRVNGLDVNRVKLRKPMLTRPITASTWAAKRSGRWPPSIATARVQPARIRAHSTSDPSCAPQTAENR